MSSTKLSDLQDYLALCSSPEDFAEYDRLEAELLGATKAADSRWDVRTLSEVAEFFGVEEQTVRTWRLRTPAMPGTPGSWPIKEIVRWRCDLIQQSGLAAAKRQQDYDLGKILVEQKQLELDREKGQLLDRSDVELWAATAIIEAREMIMSLPERLAVSSPPDQRSFIREETDRHCRDVLTMLRRRLEMEQLVENATDTEAESIETL